MKLLVTAVVSISIFSSCSQLVTRGTIANDGFKSIRQGDKINDVMMRMGQPTEKIEGKQESILLYSSNTQSCIEGFSPIGAIANVYPGFGLPWYFYKKSCDSTQSNDAIIFKNDKFESIMSGLGKNNFFVLPDGNIGIAANCHGGSVNCLNIASKACGKVGYTIIEKKVVGANSESSTYGYQTANASGNSTTTYNPYSRSLATTGIATATGNSYSQSSSSSAIVEEILFKCN
jgi:hypothetical protein